MNTKDMTTNYRLAHWAQVMRERRESGLTVKAFCREAGFRENMYYYWQRRLREAACEQVVQNSPVACFTEVRLEPAPAKPALPEPADRQSGRLCIEISGMRLTADGDYPPEQLARLLRELAPC